MDTEKPSDRKGFLKKIGAAIGVAVGALALPSVARAAPLCCRTNCTTCTGTDQPYYCSCPGFSYCACFSTSQPTCFSAPC